MFPVRSVAVYVSRPRDGEEGGVLLNLELHCGKASEEVVPDGEQTGWTRPMVEVWVPVPDATPRALHDLRVTIPWSYLAARDARHRLYVFEHEDLWNLDVRLRHVEGPVCHVSLTGTARDPNHYDGSKPEATVHAEADFELE